MPLYAIGKPGGPAHWLECRGKVPARQIGEGEVRVPYRGTRCRARIAADGRAVEPVGDVPSVPAATWQDALARLHEASTSAPADNPEE